MENRALLKAIRNSEMKIDSLQPIIEKKMAEKDIETLYIAIKLQIEEIDRLEKLLKDLENEDI